MAWALHPTVRHPHASPQTKDRQAPPDQRASTHLQHRRLHLLLGLQGLHEAGVEHLHSTPTAKGHQGGEGFVHT
jgi:hypothetical protein